MKNYTLLDVAQYVDMHSHVINFGTQDNAPDDVRIKTAENTLDLQFTSSYKGCGISSMENDIHWHHKVLKDEKYNIAFNEIQTKI
ncbi:hypothetical protein MCO_01821 [Bartonella sp. DB5-6]|nr:hypothetical protein MCO_01821 [Bartonella sp. DB5-6]